MYIIVTSPNGRSYYLAKSRIGGGYSTVATFMNEGLAKETADVLNAQFDANQHVKRTKLREVK